MCGSLAHVTSRIPFWSSIQPIYHGHPSEVAITAHLHEVSEGRFRLGIGVSHGPPIHRLGSRPVEPLSTSATTSSPHPGHAAGRPVAPVCLATLRDKMLDLALEVADGAIWANGSFSHTPTQLARIPADRRETFSLANMVPTVIDDDKAAARAIHRRTLTTLHRRCRTIATTGEQAGYETEMDGHRGAIDAGDRDALPG